MSQDEKIMMNSSLHKCILDMYIIYIYDFPFGSEFLRDLLSIDTMFRPPVREEPEIEESDYKIWSTFGMYHQSPTLNKS